MENKINNTNSEFYIVIELWNKYKHWWPRFALSVFISLGIAFAFIYIWPKSYKRTALVMIRDDSKKSDITAALGDKFVVSMSSNVKNEVEAFRSPKLIQEVLIRLDLTTQYSIFNKLRKEYLYHQTPVEALFPEATNDDFFKFKVQLKPNNEVILTKFKNRKKSVYGQVQGKLGDTISTPVGKVLLSPTLHYGIQWFNTTISIEKNAAQNATLAFAKNMSASLVSKDNSIIQLEINSSNPSRAENFLNELITMYNENWMREKNTIAESTWQFLNEQLPIIKKELDEIDVQLEQHKSRNPLTNVQSGTSLIMSKSSEYAGRIVDVGTQLSFTRLIKDHLNANDNITSFMPSNSGLNNPTIESQFAQYNQLLMERDGLLANSSERNNVVADKNAKLQAMRQSIVQAVDNQIVTLNLQLKTLQSQEDRMNRQITSNPIQERQLVLIERERKTKESQYLYMLQKKEDNEMSLIMETINTRIISPPTGPEKPVKPQKLLFCLIALFVGFGIPGSVIVVKEGLSTNIKGKSDLDGLSVPLLGVVALADPENKKSGLSCLVSESGRDMVNETFRMVRTNVDDVCDKQKKKEAEIADLTQRYKQGVITHKQYKNENAEITSQYAQQTDDKVIMFTSFEPGGGKTFVALNLAMSFALAGKKVALVDVDMRVATLSKVIDSPPLGYCSYLNGAVTYAQLLQYHVQKDRFYKNFDIFPVGKIPLNPTELLMSDRFAEFVEKIKKKYDYVFLDCTPLDNVADATIVSKLADISVFIVRENHTDRRKLRDIERTFELGQFKNMNLILNASNLEVTASKHHAEYKKSVMDVFKQITQGKVTYELPEKTEKTEQKNMKQIGPGAVDSHHSIRDEEDLRGLSVPLLGVIELIGKENLDERVSYISNETGKNKVNEIFSGLRSAIGEKYEQDRKSKLKVVMLTSFEEGSGKTFVALNLALNFAHADKKVALVDVDLRNATLSQMFDKLYTSKVQGYCSFLNDNTVTFRQLTQSHIFRNHFDKPIDIFTIGNTFPTNPKELLESDRFGELMNQLKKKYNYVFLNCPSVKVDDDANIISKFADLSVFIVREDHTNRDDLYELNYMYRQEQFKNMSLILNGSKSQPQRSEAPLKSLEDHKELQVDKLIEG